MLLRLGITILTLNSYLHIVLSGISSEISDPKFAAPIENVTASVGREAILTCQVSDLGTFKVAWLRVDTQTILTIQNNVITKNQRIGITFAEKKTWQLRIKDIRESDRGWYMCQLNTEPMKSQLGYLEVTVPPDILDYPTSTDMIVPEGRNVTLKCAATGSPTPNITWRKESGERIMLNQTHQVMTVEGPILNIQKVDRKNMGSYLCIASNGVPPTVSKRITLIVQFSPMISIANQLTGAYEGQPAKLECHTEAFPKSINYWTGEKGQSIIASSSGGRFNFEQIEMENYKVVMRLTINPVTKNDYGTYKCVSRNSLGETEGSIKLYHIPRNANSVDSSDYRMKNRKGKHNRNKENSLIESNDISDGKIERKELILSEPNGGDAFDLTSSTTTVASFYRSMALVLLASSIVSVLN